MAYYSAKLCIAHMHFMAEAFHVNEWKVHESVWPRLYKCKTGLHCVELHISGFRLINIADTNPSFRCMSINLRGILSKDENRIEANRYGSALGMIHYLCMYLSSSDNTFNKRRVFSTLVMRLAQCSTTHGAHEQRWLSRAI